MDAFDTLSDPAARILDIEARQDEALLQLADLELRIEQVLAECLALTGKAPPAAGSPIAPLAEKKVPGTNGTSRVRKVKGRIDIDTKAGRA